MLDELKTMNTKMLRMYFHSLHTIEHNDFMQVVVCILAVTLIFRLGKEMGEEIYYLAHL